jgi:hypothetical protein
MILLILLSLKFNCHMVVSSIFWIFYVVFFWLIIPIFYFQITFELIPSFFSNIFVVSITIFHFWSPRVLFVISSIFVVTLCCLPYLLLSEFKCSGGSIFQDLKSKFDKVLRVFWLPKVFPFNLQGDCKKDFKRVFQSLQNNMLLVSLCDAHITCSLLKWGPISTLCALFI